MNNATNSGNLCETRLTCPQANKIIMQLNCTAATSNMKCDRISEPCCIYSITIYKFVTKKQPNLQWNKSQLPLTKTPNLAIASILSISSPNMFTMQIDLPD